MRALFVNSGLLGHRAVARLVQVAAAQMPGVDAAHIDLSGELTPSERVMRRAFSLQLAPAAGAAANLDLRRWRQEVNVGLLARRRIAQYEQRCGAVDVLHMHTQAVAYASVGRMRRTPTIVSIDATQRLASLEHPAALARWTYRPNIGHDGCVFRAAAAIVSTSAWAARDLASLYPDCAAKTHVIPYPVDLSAFDASWTAERARRADAGAPPRVLFVGGDFPRKGGFDLLDAWREGEFCRRASLNLVTDFPLERRSLPDGVVVTSRVAPYSAEWRAVWRDADLFVMPTRQEAFGMVFQEAAAAGLAAIAPRINAIPELVEDGVTGLLIEPGDRRALVDALDSLIGRADRRAGMARAARCRIERVAAPEVYARRLMNVLEGATGKA